MAGCSAEEQAAPPDTAASSIGPGGPAGWTLTVYYTAVELFHAGAPTTVRGCTRLDCVDGDADLGTYPTGFVQAVKDEGTGRTTDGRYLNWSFDTGYWLDDAPRDTRGRPLRPFESAAADPDTMTAGTAFTITDCGHVEEGGPPPEPVCGRLRAARWRITDEFTPGLGGPRHLDLYIGEETGPGFTETDWFITLTGATLTPRDG